MTASRISSSTPYQEHWPSILSHSRSAQPRSESSEDFGQTFREQLSTSDDPSGSTKPVQPSPNRSVNETAASQPDTASATALANTQQATARSVASHAKNAEILGLPKDLPQSKLVRGETPSGNNGASVTGKTPRKVYSRGEAGPGDSRAEATELPPGDQQMAVALPNDMEPETDDEESAVGELQESNQVDGTDSATSTGLTTGDLAMAMRISSGTADSNQMQGPGGIEQGMAAPNSLGLHNQAQLADTLESQPRREPEPPQAAGAFATTPSGSSSQTEKAGRTEESASEHSADFEAEFNKFRSEPVRGAHVQIAGAGNQLVDIRMQERGGALSVSVRSSDGTLARTLQDHAPELNARLSLEHFRTELWTPNSNGNPQERSGSGNTGQGQGQQEGNESEHGQGRKGKQNQEPEWVNEFENHPAAFQKRIDYTWHQ